MICRVPATSRFRLTSRYLEGQAAQNFGESMSIVPGRRLGPYEILSAIGAGAMGAVYRARDTKLGRDVALKLLPEEFEREPDRMARFEGEARFLASLNHPNIAAIYGFEESGEARALVMELVEGPTLADRIKQGAIAMDEALLVAKQICEALEYAHERGIIHRDLKPANIKLARNDKLTNNNVVKILDFGLAKAIQGNTSSTDVSGSPTISTMRTYAGIILGTAAYMSPQQAQSKPIDQRTDIWAFGCVLYEILTSQMPFYGETLTDTLAAVLKEDPDWSRLPATTHPQVRLLLQRCLKKEVKLRLQAIGDARIVLEEVLSGALDDGMLGAVVQPAKQWRGWLPWALTALLFFTLAPIAFLYFRGTPPLAEPVRFQIPLPASSRSFTLSPDGRRLAFIAPGLNGRNFIWIRALDTLEAHPLAGTENASAPPVFWSPDSRLIAFQAGNMLKKIDLAGAPPQDICETRVLVLGGSWNRKGIIIFGTDGEGIMQVAAVGGVATRLTTAPGHNQVHVFPSFLPDGRHFVYLRWSEKPGVSLGSLDTKPEQQDPKPFLATPLMPVYAPSADPAQGQLLFMREGTLMAQSFDSRRLALVGEPTAVADNVGNLFLSGSFSVSANGILAYRRATAPSALTWYDRQGKVLSIAQEPGAYTYTVALSPDGTRVATSRVDPSVTGPNPGIWVHEFGRSVSSRLTFDLAPDSAPVWSPDGSRIAFTAIRAGGNGLYQKNSNGAGKEEVLLPPTNDFKVSNDWSRDGRFLLYTIQDPKTNSDLWVAPLTADAQLSGPPAPFANTQFSEQQGQFSPDSRWIAYVSDESGRPEIHVQAFPVPAGGGGKTLISRDGGTQPRWRRDGKELFYVSLDGKMMAVDVSSGQAFKTSVPKVLFQAPFYGDDSAPSLFRWDTVADGKRFLVDTVESSPEPLTMVLNWMAGVKMTPLAN
jgi:serine/threonine protein kinase/Tol biopolymer transport system component